MKQIDEYTYQYESKQEAWRDDKKDRLSLWRHWLEWRFYYLVMEYLDEKRPDELLKEEFKTHCMYIYEHDVHLYKVVWIKFEDLMDSHYLQKILEDWNDLFLNELDEND